MPKWCLAQRAQEVTGESVELAFVDQGYTGDDAAEAAEEHGMRLEVVKLPQAKKGFVLLRAAGSWSEPPGRDASAALHATTNGCPRPWPDCIFWPSSAFCLAVPWLHSCEVHNRL